jgi:hypothetical protein
MVLPSRQQYSPEFTSIHQERISNYLAKRVEVMKLIPLPVRAINLLQKPMSLSARPCILLLKAVDTVIHNCYRFMDYKITRLPTRIKS